MSLSQPAPSTLGARADGDWRAALHDVAHILRIIAPSICLVLTGAAMVVGSAQSVEAVRVIAEERDAGRWAPLIVFVLAMVFAGLSAWYWARVLVYLLHVERPDGTRLGKLAEVHLPRVCGAVPPLAGAWAAWKASRPWLALAGVAIAVALYVFFALRRFLLTPGENPQSTPARQTTVKTLPFESRILLATTSLLWLVLLVAVASTRGRALALLGPVSVLLVSIGTWIPALSAWYYWGRTIRLPLVSLLALAVFVFSLLNLNDNHVVRHDVVEGRGLPPSFASSFTAWLKSRADLAGYDEYPVFFVATEGGGLRAAYFTSLVLSAIQDRCPQFAQHLFAISSVSGGSVGSGIFAGLAAQRARNVQGLRCAAEFESPGAFQRLADSVLAKDFLTPLFAQGLYPDLLQRGLPFPIYPWDRARALEHGFERSWTDVTGGHQFAAPFHSLWPDFARGATPALFLNTTRVETGARMVISNLHPVEERFDGLVSLADVDPRLDLPLSTALTLSARFPIVTPIGSVPAPGDSVFRYADGGYFDDSGATTLMEMLSALYLGEGRDTVGRPRFVPVVIRIGFDVAQRLTDDPGRKFTSSGLNEVFSPIRTLLNTRDAHAAIATEQLRTFMAALLDRGVQSELIEFTLTQDQVPLVLGWLMSGKARAEMTRQLGPARPCDLRRGVDNGCSYQSVVAWLTRVH